MFHVGLLRNLETQRIYKIIRDESWIVKIVLKRSNLQADRIHPPEACLLPGQAPSYTIVYVRIAFSNISTMEQASFVCLLQSFFASFQFLTFFLNLYTPYQLFSPVQSSVCTLFIAGHTSFLYKTLLCTRLHNIRFWIINSKFNITM